MTPWPGLAGGGLAALPLLFSLQLSGLDPRLPSRTAPGLGLGGPIQAPTALLPECSPSSFLPKAPGWVRCPARPLSVKPLPACNAGHFPRSIHILGLQDLRLPLATPRDPRNSLLGSSLSSWGPAGSSFPALMGPLFNLFLWTSSTPTPHSRVPPSPFLCPDRILILTTLPAFALSPAALPPLSPTCPPPPVGGHLPSGLLSFLLFLPCCLPAPCGSAPRLLLWQV